jgi:hypothetical protein
MRTAISRAFALISCSLVIITSAFIIGGAIGGIKVLTTEDLQKLEHIKQFVTDQGMTNLSIDITGVCSSTRIHMTFTVPSSQRRIDGQAVSVGRKV